MHFICIKSECGGTCALVGVTGVASAVKVREVPRSLMGKTVFPILYTLHLESQPNHCFFNAGNFTINNVFWRLAIKCSLVLLLS